MSEAAGRRQPAAARSLVALFIFLLILVGGSALRLIRLDNRLMHCDEAVHAIKFGDLLQQGRYVYDPREYHGPSLSYLTLPIIRLQGVDRLTDVSETDLRLLPAIFGILLIAVTWLLREELGLSATLLTAVLTACSPGAVFYSRYYIQEMLLAGFTFGAVVTLWRLDFALETQNAKSRILRTGLWLVLLGLCLGMMHASKETCVIAWFAMGLAVVTTMKNLRRAKWRQVVLALVIVISVAAGVSALFHSSFLQNPRGVVDSMGTYLHYLQRAGGGGSAGPHDHPWYSYLRWLFWQPVEGGSMGVEAVIGILACVGLLATVTGRGISRTKDRSTQVRDIREGAILDATNRYVTNPDGNRIDSRRLQFARFVSVYTLAMLLIYSVMPYKTPWCAVGFLHGLVLMAAIGGAALLTLANGTAGRRAVGVLIFAGLTHLSWEAFQTCFVAQDDSQNPYVYAHTSRDIPRLVDRLEQLAACHPDGLAMHVQVVCRDDDYWPLPWYMRDFSRVAWFRDVPNGPAAPVIVTQPELERAILDYLYVSPPPGQRPLYFELKQEDSDTAYHLRPFVPLRVYVRLDLWQEYQGREAQPISTRQ